MRFISALFKILAFILMAFVVLALPVALLGRNVGAVVFSPEAILALVRDNFLESETAAAIAQEMVTSALGDAATGDNPATELVQTGLSNLTEAQWEHLTQLVAPEELLVETLNQILKGFYGWLDGLQPAPEFNVDFEPWKANITENSAPSRMTHSASDAPRAPARVTTSAARSSSSKWVCSRRLFQVFADGRKR